LLCCHYPTPLAGHDGAFTVDASRVTFGRGSIEEVGARTRAYGVRRVGLFTDARVAALPFFARARRSLEGAGLEVAVFDAVVVEPTDRSFLEAARFAVDAKVDGFVSVGGGSVIDTCKAAALLATYPADELDAYVNPPVGRGVAIPGPLRPHVACPTTSGTGSEVTGIAIFDHTGLHAKTGIASRLLRPSEAIVDPDATATLPSAVVAASGLDVLCHAIESFTARPFVDRARPASPASRPMSQGRNPWSDLGCVEAIDLCRRFLVRALDPSDAEAREGMMWAATLAGIAFGNAGVHLPHAMAYAVAGLAHETGWVPGEGYPSSAGFVPHGFAVALGGPATLRVTGTTSPERHLRVATLLGADLRGAAPSEAGAIAADTLSGLMQHLAAPGLGDVGATGAHVPNLVAGTLPQRRLLDNAPLSVDAPLLTRLFQDALTPR
jgi:hydroxyacid-oxoacid transhydrogenase